MSTDARSLRALPSAEQTELATERPRRALTWRSALLLSLGGVLLVTVSLGAMAAEIGAASVLVWGGTALIGLLQCCLLAELATRFPQKVGGAPAYTHEGLKRFSPLFGAVATWSYWVAWIPGVAVNLMLAATYLEATFLPGMNTIALTLALAALLYALNSLGIRPSVWLSGVMACCALVPLAIILLAPLFREGVWQNAHFVPLIPAGLSFGVLLKWAFVAVWSSYGAEMVATVVGELRDPARDAPKAVAAASTATLLAFALVPTVLLGLIGVNELAQDPSVAFLTASSALFGSLGAEIISVMLIAALLLGAEVFIISSSRALYQMSQDGLTMQGYGLLNRRGVPIGSIGWDAAITVGLLLIFGGDILSVVAAANVGYLVVFILLPVAYVVVRAGATARASFHLPAIFVPIAALLALFNALLLVGGGAQWGGKVVLTGILLLLTFVPFYLWRRWKEGHRLVAVYNESP